MSNATNGATTACGTIYMSDYDLLVVTKRRLGERESTVEARVRERFAAGKNDENLPRPQIINESISKLNDALTMGRYFYVEIVAKGIMLYDSGECLLTTPKELDYAEIKAMAEEYYNKRVADANDYLWGALQYYNVFKYDKAIFLLHQATENYLKAIPLVYILYGYKEHDLEFLIGKCKPYTLELAKVFPCDTDEEKRLFDLLRRAYLEARYNDKFVVTKVDIDALVPKIELLRILIEDICSKQIGNYG